jgi:hypothetical protein
MRRKKKIIRKFYKFIFGFCFLAAKEQSGLNGKFGRRLYYSHTGGSSPPLVADFVKFNFTMENVKNKFIQQESNDKDEISREQYLSAVKTIQDYALQESVKIKKIDKVRVLLGCETVYDFIDKAGFSVRARNRLYRCFEDFFRKQGYGSSYKVPFIKIYDLPKSEIINQYNTGKKTLDEIFSIFEEYDIVLID